MQSNIDHDVFIKKGKSQALELEVNKFLGKSRKPTEIPYGHSGVTLKQEWQSPQEAMREKMKASVSETGTETREMSKPLTKEQQRHKFNFEAKNKAMAEGKDTFQGKCDLHGLTEYKFYKSGKQHCIKCRAISTKRHQEKRS